MKDVIPTTHLNGVKRQPVLSSERLLEQIAEFTPEDIYNLPPLPQETEEEESEDD